MPRKRSDNERERNRLRERDRQRRLRATDPAWLARERARSRANNRKRRSDAAKVEHDRAVRREYMARLRADPDYRERMRVYLSGYYRGKQLDAELEHFLSGMGADDK